MSREIFMSLGICCFFIISCAPISKQAKHDLAKPVSCNSASRDIAILKTEKASVVKEISAGVQDIYPASALVHLLIEENYQEGWKVASGKYNKSIDEKISQIKRECRVH